MGKTRWAPTQNIPKGERREEGEGTKQRNKQFFSSALTNFWLRALKRQDTKSCARRRDENVWICLRQTLRSPNTPPPSLPPSPLSPPPAPPGACTLARRAGIYRRPASAPCRTLERYTTGRSWTPHPVWRSLSPLWATAKLEKNVCAERCFTDNQGTVAFPTRTSASAPFTALLCLLCRRLLPPPSPPSLHLPLLSTRTCRGLLYI